MVITVVLVLNHCKFQNGEWDIRGRNESDPCLPDENINTRTVGKTEILMSG